MEKRNNNTKKLTKTKTTYIHIVKNKQPTNDEYIYMYNIMNEAVINRSYWHDR